MKDKYLTAKINSPILMTQIRLTDDDLKNATTINAVRNRSVRQLRAELIERAATLNESNVIFEIVKR